MSLGNWRVALTVPAVLATLLLGGCRRQRSAVEARAANEFSCPVEDVQVQELGAGAYRVWACGWFVQYVCHRGGGVVGGTYMPSGVTCVRESQPVRYR